MDMAAAWVAAGAGMGVLIASREFGNSFVNLPHLFASKGIGADVVVHHRNYLRHSRWIRQCFLTAEDDVEFSQEVIKRLKTGDYRFLVIVDEPALTAIYANPTCPEIAEYLPLDPAGALAKTIGRKDLFHDWCEAHDIPTPKTLRTSSWERTEQFCQELGWPCVLKGINGYGGQAVFIVNSLEEARQHRQRLVEDACWIVQEHVEGMVGSAPLFSARGELRAWMAIEKTICLLNGKGPRVMGAFMQSDALEQVCKKVARAGQLHCMTAFDFIQKPSGEIVVIDPHFGRCATIFHVGRLCGVDFGAAVKDWLDGKESFYRPKPCNTRIVKYPEAIQFVFEFGLARLLREGMPFRKNVKYFLGPPRDWKLFTILTWLTFYYSSRVALGGWRAKRKKLKQKS